MKPDSQKYLIRSIYRIINDKGQRVMTAYLIHSLPLLMSAVQIFSGDQMAVVGHLVGLEQLGYEKDIGMTEAVSKTRFLTTTTPWPRTALYSVLRKALRTYYMISTAMNKFLKMGVFHER